MAYRPILIQTPTGSINRYIYIELKQNVAPEIYQSREVQPKNSCQNNRTQINTRQICAAAQITIDKYRVRDKKFV